MSRSALDTPRLDSALTLRFTLAARQRELQGMADLAQTCELVIAVGQLIHALQKERGQAMLHVSQPSQLNAQATDQAQAWQAQVALVEAAELALREQLARGLRDNVWPLTKPRCLHAVAHALNELDGLPALRQRLAQLSLSAEQALEAYARAIGRLLGVSIEALEGATNLHITHALVALLNFMQAKELCGQERAHGVLGFTAGAFDAQSQRLMAGLVQAQERSLELFCQHAPAQVMDRWQTMRADETALQRLRQLSQGGALDAALAGMWFDVCTARIDAMHELECELALHVAACCRDRVAETEQELLGLNCISDQYQSTPIEWKAVSQNTLVGRPLEMAVTGDALARPVLDVLLEQGARLHEADKALAQARRVQRERRSVEQAKWRLVSQHGMSEAAAHKQLLQMAMNAGETLQDVAERILRESGAHSLDDASR